MKEYKSNDDLINHLISKGVIVENKKDAARKIEKYTYYAIVNTYKEVFKDGDKYFNSVTFDEIYSLYDFDKNLRAIFLKYVFTKVCTDNFYSLNNFLKDNYTIVHEYYNERGKNTALIRKID